MSKKNTFLSEWAPIKPFLQVREYSDSFSDSNSGYTFNSFGGYDHPIFPISFYFVEGIISVHGVSLICLELQMMTPAPILLI